MSSRYYSYSPLKTTRVAIATRTRSAFSRLGPLNQTCSNTNSKTTISLSMNRAARPLENKSSLYTPLRLISFAARDVLCLLHHVLLLLLRRRRRWKENKASARASTSVSFARRTRSRMTRKKQTTEETSFDGGKIASFLCPPHEARTKRADKGGLRSNRCFSLGDFQKLQNFIFKSST